MKKNPKTKRRVPLSSGAVLRRAEKRVSKLKRYLQRSCESRKLFEPVTLAINVRDVVVMIEALDCYSQSLLGTADVIEKSSCVVVQPK